VITDNIGCVKTYDCSKHHVFCTQKISAADIFVTFYGIWKCVFAEIVQSIAYF